MIRDERGYSLPELITTMAVLSVVLGGLTSLFVAGSNADADLNRRFQAQSDARVAMDRLRREVHRACGVSGITPGTPSSSVTFLYPSGTTCALDAQSVSWCAVGSGTRYGLYRIQAQSCTGATAKFADYLTYSTPFTFTNGDTTTHALARLNVDLRINRTPTKTVNAYRLTDDIAFRNFTRL